MLGDKLYAIYKAYKEKEAKIRRESEPANRRFRQKYGHLNWIDLRPFQEDKQLPDVLPETLEEFLELVDRKDANSVAVRHKPEDGPAVDESDVKEENLEPNGDANLPSEPFSSGLKEVLEEFYEPFDNHHMPLPPEFTLFRDSTFGSTTSEEFAQDLDVDDDYQNFEPRDCIAFYRVSKAIEALKLEDQQKEDLEGAQIADEHVECEVCFFKALGMVKKSEQRIAKVKVSVAEEQEIRGFEHESSGVACLKDGSENEAVSAATGSLEAQVDVPNIQEPEPSALVEESEKENADCNAAAAENGVDVENGGSEFVETLTKKRKRGSPLVIPDFITVFEGVPGAIATMYQCNVCNGRKFRTTSNFKLHEFCGMEDHLKPFQCDHCGKGFVYESHCRAHLRSHFKEKPDARIRNEPDHDAVVRDEEQAEKDDVLTCEFDEERDEMEVDTHVQPNSSGQMEKTNDKMKMPRDEISMECVENNAGESVCKKRKIGSTFIIPDYIRITGVLGELPMFQCNVCKNKFRSKYHAKYHAYCVLKKLNLVHPI